MISSRREALRQRSSWALATKVLDRFFLHIGGEFSVESSAAGIDYTKVLQSQAASLIRCLPFKVSLADSVNEHAIIKVYVG